jgi:hypothetical protein
VDSFGLAIDAVEAVGEPEGAVPIDGGPGFLGEYLATLRQLEKRPLSMARRCWELRGR